MPDDAELLRRYAEEKSEDAFAELVRRHLDLVYAVALRKVGGDAHLAQDVAQQVFAAAARKAASLARHPVLTGWLFTSAHYAAVQAVRAEHRRRVREAKAEAMSEIDRESGAAVDWERLRPLLDDVVRELPERDREAVLLRYFEGRPLAEVGARLRLSEEGARSRVERALGKLHASLTRRGVTSTAAALGVALANQAGVAAPAGLAVSVTGTALAGVAGAGGAMTAANILTFMSTTKTVAGVAGIVALLGWGALFFEVGALRESQASLSLVGKERDALRARLAAAERDSVRAEATPSTVSAELRESGAKAADNSRAAPTSARVGGTMEYVLDHPEMRSAFLQRSTLALKARFDRFFQSAGLTGEQQDKFLRIAMNEAEMRLDALAIRRAAGGLDPNVPMDRDSSEKLSALEKRNDTEATTAFRELLGEKSKPAMEYLTTLDERNTADKLAGLVYHTGEPLTPQQSEQLVQIMMQNRYRSGATASPDNTLGGTFIPREIFNGAMFQAMTQDVPWMRDAPVTDAAMARAVAVLTPRQLAALQLLQAQQAAELQLVPPAKSKDRPPEPPKNSGK